MGKFDIKSQDLVATGEAAKELAYEVLTDDVLGDITYSDGQGNIITIAKGTTDTKMGIVYLGASSDRMFYLCKDGVANVKISSFFGGVAADLGGFSREIKGSTAWIKPTAEAMADFSLAVLIAFTGPFGKAAGIGVKMAKAAVFYDQHKKKVDLAVTLIPEFFQLMRWLSQHCPVTYEHLLKIMGTSLKLAITSAPQGLDIKWAMKLLGKLVTGAMKLKKRSLSAVVMFIAKTLGGALPGLAMGGLKARGKATAKDIQKAFQDAGIIVGTSDASVMSAELALQSSQDKLALLLDVTSKLSPLIAELADAWAEEG